MSCPDCLSGHEHAGTPQGSVLPSLHGVPTYVSQPPAAGQRPKGAVLFLPDIYGWKSVNSRLLCDAYAEKGGFVVYLPDLMAGRCLPTYFMAVMENVKQPAGWFTTLFWKPIWVFQMAQFLLPFFIINRQSVVQSRISKFLTGIRSDPATAGLKIGAAGFCWGGKYAFLLAHDTSATSLIECAFAAHPSMLSVPGDVERVRLPMSVAVGDTDMALSVQGIRMLDEVLVKKGRGDHEVVVLDGAKHGFAVRLDPRDELQDRYAGVAESQAIAWFTKWLSA